MRPEDNVLRGILFMCLSGLFFPVMNAFAKYLSGYYPSVEVIWARNLSHLIVVLALFVPRRGLVRLIRSRRPMIQLVRSLMLLSATVFFFTGVKYVPLVKASSISFTTPLIVTLLSVLFLGERSLLYRWAAVAVGFAGVLIVIRPGTEVFHWASFLILGSATSYAAYQVQTRRMAGLDTPETAVVYAAVVGTVVMSLIVPFAWVTPHGLLHVAMFVGMGFCGAMGHYCMAKAMEMAPASIMSPFNYVQLLGATLFGYLMFNDLPDLWMGLGAAIIVGSGLYLVWRETRQVAARRAG